MTYTTKYFVEYYESERGWGSDVWETAYDTKDEALAATKETNDKYMNKSYTPDYYIRATYVGERAVKES